MRTRVLSAAAVISALLLPPAATARPLSLSVRTLDQSEPVKATVSSRAVGGRIEWGDGTSTYLRTRKASHTYSDVGRFRIVVRRRGKALDQRYLTVRAPSGTWIYRYGSELVPELRTSDKATTVVRDRFTNGYWLLSSDGTAELKPTKPRYSSRQIRAQQVLTDVRSLDTSDSDPNEMTAILRGDKTVWFQGDASWGQLGDGVADNANRFATAPVQVPGLTGAKQVTLAGGTSFALLEDGTVWGWGSGIAGALARGPRLASTPSYSPVKIIDGVVSFAASAATVGYAVRSDGSLWSWGCGTGGGHATGVLDGEHYLEPRQMQGLPPVDRVIVSESAKYVIARDGTVWTWGFETGLAGGAPVLTPRRIPGLLNPVDVVPGLALRADGRLVRWSEGGAEVLDQPRNVIATEGLDDGQALLLARNP